MAVIASKFSPIPRARGSRDRPQRYLIKEGDSEYIVTRQSLNRQRINLKAKSDALKYPEPDEETHPGLYRKWVRDQQMKSKIDTRLTTVKTSISEVLKLAE